MQEDNSSIDKYNKDGYLIIENLFDEKLVLNLYGFIKTSLNEYANEINTSFENYVSATGRWGPKSSLFKNDIFNNLNNKIKSHLESLTGNKISLHKQNVICKNEYVTGSLALHQDISYSHNSPYNFTVWLSLNNILPDSGEMIVIPKSHKWPIERAVDFWSPYLKDKKIEKYKDYLKKIYLKPGDALLFDSRLWHGSVENLKKASRYAYVTRWLIEDYQFPHIPEPQSLEFGMWNCHEQLKEMLMKLNEIDTETPFEDLLNKTQELMIQKRNSKAVDALERLFVLHKATELHDAGDLCGKTYKKVWDSLLVLSI
jgi:ectoine hydroxylase-related dioxygenase (phytanoyl-CoA dioxygenase family)